VSSLISGIRIKLARTLLGWDEAELARRASVRILTVQRAESVPGEPPVTIAQREKIPAALESAGVEFTTNNAPGVRLRATGKEAE
jgi:transcriptional regulator with XRE-family HTH domain